MHRENSINETAFPLFFVFALVATSFLSTLASADPGTGLQTSVAVDIVGQTLGKSPDTKKGANSSRLMVREAELTLYAPVDHHFDGTLSLAAHQEAGQAFFEIHEATISSSKLLPYSNIKVGQFFLGLGRLNRTHRHDWPFIDAPKVHKEFFGQEGVLDSGGEITTVSPVWIPAELTLGITNGWTFGHSHSEGSPPKKPNTYARLSLFQQLPLDGGLQIGLNALRRINAENQNSTFLGADWTAKWKESKQTDFLWQGEVWQRVVKTPNSAFTKSLGFYTYQQIPLFSSVDFGLLYDGYSILNLEDITGKKVKNFDQGFSPSIGWASSEFSKFRLAYNRRYQKFASEKSKFLSANVMLQTTFILGSHPAHDF